MSIEVLVAWKFVNVLLITAYMAWWVVDNQGLSNDESYTRMKPVVAISLMHMLEMLILAVVGNLLGG
jgi:hypothetical protein